MSLADIANQRVCTGEDDPAAHTEQKQKKDDNAISAGTRQQVKGERDAREAEDEPAFLPSLSSNGPTASEAIINPSACAKAMVPFWLGVR